MVYGRNHFANTFYHFKNTLFYFTNVLNKTLKPLDKKTLNKVFHDRKHKLHL